MYNMYNEAQKKKFIKDYSDDQYIISLFNYCEGAEKIKGKDVSCFREEEIYELLTGMNSLSLNTLIVKLSVLRTYATWCEQRGLLVTNMNCYKNIRKEDVTHCVNQIAAKSRIIDKETMLKYCDELVNPADKLLVMCIFEGVKTSKGLEALGGLSKDQVYSKYIQLKDRKVKISEELYKMVQLTNETDEYFPVFGSSEKAGTAIRLIKSNFVFRPKYTSIYGDDAVKNASRLKARFTKYISAYTNPNLTITSLFWSGVIHNLKLIAKKNKISISMAMETSEFDEVIKQYGIKNTKGYVSRKINNYLN